MAETHGIFRVRTAAGYVTGGPDWALPVHTPGFRRRCRARRPAGQLALLDLSILSIVGEADQTRSRRGNQNLADACAIRCSSGNCARYDQAWQTPARARRPPNPAPVADRHQLTASWLVPGGWARKRHELRSLRRIVALAGQAETALLGDDPETGADLIVEIADIVFAVEKFAPKNPLANRDDVIRHWVHGNALVGVPVTASRSRSSSKPT